MLTIPEIMNLDDQKAVEAVQVRITGVYERKTGIGKFNTSVQNIEGSDITGNKIRIVAWGHPELNVIKGKEVIVHAVKGQGVKVLRGSYESKREKNENGTPKRVFTVELEVSKTGQFQFVEVWQQNNGVKPAAQSPITANPSHSEGKSTRGDTNLPETEQKPVESKGTAPAGKRPVFGATVGMALNNVVSECGNTGVPVTEDVLWKRASMYIRVAQRLESGDLHSDA
jgi:hypothetical protein